MQASSFLAFLHAHANSPFWCFAGIVLLSYLLEDLAIVTAAGLAVEGYLSPFIALSAVFVGIATGDLALYLLGRYGQRVRWLRFQTLRHKSFRKVRARIQQNAFVSLFIIRFVPGLRTLGYTLSGYCLVPVLVFFCAVMLATALWTIGVFGSIYWLGEQIETTQSSLLGWWLLGAFCLVTALNRIVNRSLIRGKYSL